MPAEVPVLANSVPLLESCNEHHKLCLCCWCDLRAALVQPFQLPRVIMLAKILSKRLDGTCKMLCSSLLPQHLLFLIEEVGFKLSTASISSRIVNTELK